MAHDFATQKAETFSAFAELQAANDLPDVADLELFFVPATKSGWQPLAAALAELGFTCDWAEGEAGAPGTLMAMVEDQPLSAASIWLVEELASKTALEHGFAPDGWGFAAD